MKSFHHEKAKTVIIVGCGVLGTALAEALSQKNNFITLIDCSKNALEVLPEHCYDDCLEGNGADAQVLRQAQIHACDQFYAVTGDDNTNLMAAQIAKTCFGVRQVFVRVDDCTKESAYSGMGMVLLSAPLLLCREFLKAAEENIDT